ncbi:hypothetical protein BDD12DRAFT_827083 [Trichophaea hybrida]|nr:hypothetical protein BDD12DRAFT_827083 [Trichophaea hybrida]
MSEATQEDHTLIYLDICPYGDMEIALTTPTIDVTYRVSSHQLCSASSVFRAMLGPQSSFSEANELRRHQRSSSTASSECSLFRITAEEEYDPTALATVLYVLHGRVEYIPESVNFEGLLEIAIICDYYDCAATMRPWDEIWMNPLQSLTSKPGYESWLFIAWVFRNQSAFGKMTESFSKCSVIVNGEFQILVDGNAKALDCHLPQGIIDAIADQRAKIGEEIVRTCRSIITKYEADNPIKCVYGVRTCDYLIFAGLCKSFKSMNLFDADAGLPTNLDLTTIVKTTISVLCDGLGSILLNLKTGSDYHSTCYNNLLIVQSLQSLLERIKPLSLTSFSRKLATSETRLQWERFLHTEGSFSRQIRRTDTDVFHLNVYEYGDMQIVLKTNKIHATYTVSSHQLRAGSPIFRDLLGQGSTFQEHIRHCHEQTLDTGLHAEYSNQETHYQLEIKKDYDPTAFSIVLYLLHARVQILPESMDFEDVISTLAICDHYHCSALLQPWNDKWIKSWRRLWKSSGYENWLFVAWVMGEGIIFQTLTKKFAQRGIFRNNEFLIAIEDDLERVDKDLSKFIPQAIIDAIIEQRNTAAEKIIQACRDIYEKYSNESTTKCRSKAGKICDHFIFGELHLGFKAAKLIQADAFNFPQNISLNRAAADLYKLSTTVMSNFDHLILGGNSHSGCAGDVVALAKSAQAALSGVKPLPLTVFGRKPAEKQVVSWDKVLSSTEEVAK